VKAFRLILKGLGAVVLLAAIVVGLAFVPGIQTWCAQEALSGHPGLQGTVGQFTATWGTVEVTDLQLKTEGAALTLPSLTADLPVVADLRSRTLRVHHLEAKGWTLDLTHRPGTLAEAEATSSVSSQEVSTAFQGLLNQWALPCDLALDGVDLEGDVLVPSAGGKSHARVHVTLRGGGLAAGHEGTFVLTATSTVLDSQMQVTELSASGRLAVTLATPRTFRRLDLTAEVSAKGGPFPAGLTLATHATAQAESTGESYALALSRGATPLARLATALTANGSQLAGTWTVNLQDSDFAPFLPDHPLPGFQVAGTGRFDCDTAFSRVHAAGDLTAVLSRLDALTPALGNLGSVNLTAGFDARHGGRLLRVERLSINLTGTGPTAALRLLGPCQWDERTGHLSPLGATANGMAVSLRRFPLGWIPGLPGGLAFTSGTVAGEFVLGAEPGGFVLQPSGPLRATGVTLQQGGSTVVQNVDATADLVAHDSPAGWQVAAAPLRLTRRGQPLGELTVQVAHPSGQDLAISGKGHADLRAVGTADAFPGLRWLAGRSASGEFTATLGEAPSWSGKLALPSDDPRDAVTASFHFDVGSEGGVAFLVPLKLGSGETATDLSAEGKWSQDENGPRLYLKLNGENVRLENLRLLAGPLAQAGHAAGTGAAAGSVPGPFWGDWVGTLQVAFDHLQAGTQTYGDVSATFEVDHTSVRLEGGHVMLDAPRAARLEGDLSFTASAKTPYQLKAAAAIDPFKAAQFFPATDGAAFPVIEGRIAIAASAAGSGADLPDLARRTETTFQLTSTDTIVRFLNTDVHEAIPQVESSRMADAVGTVGSAFGTLFGMNRDGRGAAKSLLQPNTDAVIDFTRDAAELGFDTATLIAVRDAAGNFHLTKIDLIAARERLTGTGQITAVPGTALRNSPLSLDLRFGARGRIARLLATAGLLSDQKDERGFSLLREPVHLGGSLAAIDTSAWHRLLVQAAVPRAAPKKKKNP